MRTILEIIDHLQSNLPNSHGGSPILIGDESVCDSYTYVSVTSLYEEGVIKTLKIVKVEEDEDDYDKFWLAFEIANNGNKPKLVLREQFGKRTVNMIELLDFAKSCIKGSPQSSVK